MSYRARNCSPARKPGPCCNHGCKQGDECPNRKPVELSALLMALARWLPPMIVLLAMWLAATAIYSANVVRISLA